MGERRPPIPEELKRRVRQHCGFGCAICGDMPTEIEHIIPYAEAQSHDFENLVLLCSKHHREVTAGRLSKLDIRAARECPYSRSSVATYQPLLRRQWKLKIGGLEVASEDETTIAPFLFDGVAPLKITFGNPIRFSLHMDKPGGGRALIVTDNVFEFHPEALWDVRLTGQKLSVKFGQRSTLLEVEISGGEVAIKKLSVVAGRTPILASGETIRLKGNTLERVGLTASGSKNFCFDQRISANVMVSDDQSRPGIIVFHQATCETTSAAWTYLRNKLRG